MGDSMAISTVSKNQPMREGEIAAIDALNDVITIMNRANTQLWSGSLGSGNITVNGLENYSLFAVYLENENSPCLVYSPPGNTHFIGTAMAITSTPTLFGISCNLNRNDNNLTYVYAASKNISGTSTFTKKNVVKIIGII